MDVYSLIDRFPELPYFLVALVYVFNTPLEESRHVLAVSTLYLISSIAVGISVKILLKTDRPRVYHCIPAVKYDVPSLHTLLSIGAIVLVYFVKPSYCIVLVPIGILYMYSRIRLGYHTKTAVFVGSLIGLAVGYAFGVSIWGISLGGLQLPLAVMFFVIPVSSTIFRLKYLAIEGLSSDGSVEKKVGAVSEECENPDHPVDG